jgi:hypothetical protein
MAPFNSASFPDSLAIAKEDSLTLGTIDAIQKLHIRTVHLGELPRRLALQEATHTLAVATTGLLGGLSECTLCRPRGWGWGCLAFPEAHQVGSPSPTRLNALTCMHALAPSPQTSPFLAI